MKMTVSRSMFIREFALMGREDQFSHAALGALFDWIEECEAGMGEESELDVVALCCEWTEYDDVIEAAEAYCWAPDADDDDGEPEAQDARADHAEDALAWLRDRTEVIEVPGGSVLVLAW